MTRLFLLEPEPLDLWAPFAGARPVAELRAGAWLLRERWEASLGVPCAGILGPQAEGFSDVAGPPAVTHAAVRGPAIVARADVIPPRRALAFGGAARLRVGEHDVAWELPAGAVWSGPSDEGGAIAIDGLVLRGAFELITVLERLLGSDCAEFASAPADPVPAGAIVIGEPGGVICMSAVVEPGVVFDVTRGPVVLSEGVQVRSGVRLEGPLFAGPGTRFLGGQIRRSSFGPECRVHGEVTDSVFTGYANKSHEGFVGHSVLGAWVNLGAGTTTSNLKNTYGPVRLGLPGGPVETERTLLGSLIGDHVKTAIGTMLSTGTVIGAGASLFGHTGIPRYVAPLAWGSAGTQRVALERFLTTAERVMARRGIEFTPARAEALRRFHERATR